MLMAQDKFIVVYFNPLECKQASMQSKHGLPSTGD